ncbi:MAG: PAS domain S-box protein [Alphaproteobacteria bacterium]|nr:PAS domain S-box protein [Alphaproteobacteria bacterium]
MDREQIARALLDSPAEAVVASDRDGAIVLWNTGAERVFGWSEAEALGQSLDLIIPEPQRARHWEGYDRVMATGISRYGEGDLLAAPAMRKDGIRISLEFTIAPVRDEAGEMSGMVSVIRDVTAGFLEMRELRKKLAEKSKAAG